MAEFDLSASRAVLLGSWSYASGDLPDVPAARNSFELMYTVLTSDVCGWPASSITSIRNPESPADLPDRLVQWFGEASEVALFYFVGHGQVDEEDQLCLCTAKSVTEAQRRGTTSLGYGSVRRALQASPARVKIVILDCCYSGIATEQSHSLSGSSADLAVRARANGVYTMAACGPYGAAWFEPTAPGAEPLTYFTKYFAATIRQGIAGQPARLRLNPIFLEVHSRLEAAGKPPPTRRASDTADEFQFARNAVPGVLQRDPERENTELREMLAARENELDSSRLERKQLAEQLAQMKALLASATRRQTDAPEALESIEEFRLQADRLAVELRGVETRVREDEARMNELVQPTDEPREPVPEETSRPDSGDRGEVQAANGLSAFARRRRLSLILGVALVGTLALTPVVVNAANRGNHDKQGQGLASTTPTAVHTATPAVNQSTETADSADTADVVSDPFAAKSPWRLEVTGSNCFVELLDDSGTQITSVTDADDAGSTRWLQVRSSGTFSYRIAGFSRDCKARPVPGGGTAKLPTKINAAQSDSLIVSGVDKLHIVAVPYNDQCDVLIRNSEDGKTLQEKIGLPGETLRFDALVTGRKVFVSAGVDHCRVEVSTA